MLTRPNLIHSQTAGASMLFHFLSMILCPSGNNVVARFLKLVQSFSISLMHMQNLYIYVKTVLTFTHMKFLELRLWTEPFPGIDANGLYTLAKLHCYPVSLKIHASKNQNYLLYVAATRIEAWAEQTENLVKLFKLWGTRTVTVIFA